MKPEMMKYSERFLTMDIFKGLKLDENSVLRDHTRGSVSLKELQEVLLSKDMSLYEEYKKKYWDDKKLRFLNGDPIDGNRTAYQSMARSGNTFLRKYLELITGVPTGSDMTLKYAMPLQLVGCIGEAVADDTCWVVKTHDPMRPWTTDFSTNKIIVCVRNPFDVTNSAVSFLSLWSHSKEMENQFWTEDPVYWDDFIRTNTRF